MQRCGVCSHPLHARRMQSSIARKADAVIHCTQGGCSYPLHARRMQSSIARKADAAVGLINVNNIFSKGGRWNLIKLIIYFTIKLRSPSRRSVSGYRPRWQFMFC